jgi:WD40 repeat protein
MGLYHLKSKTPLLTMRATGEDFPVSDICWCPGNSTVFACATVDAKVQIWDLNVSSIDPVVTIDTCAEDEKERAFLEGENDDDKRLGSPGSAPGSPMQASRYFDRTIDSAVVRDEDSGLSAVQRLLKKLSTDTKKKTLTSIQFGDKTPTIVVGDNRGQVTVYRIFDPVTITHQGPLQQTMKLQAAIKRLTDPSNAAMLESADGGEEETKI